MSRTPAARVLDAAEAIARSATDRQGQHVSHALVPWRFIHELRAALHDLYTQPPEEESCQP